MPVPEPNVRITKSANRRSFKVFVGDKLMTGVMGITIRQPTKRSAGPDGWEVVEKDGGAVVLIEVDAKLVAFGEDND